MTATLGVDLAPGATPDEVEAAMDLTSLSADEPIGLLSNDADKFFGRTTKVRLVLGLVQLANWVNLHCLMCLAGPGRYGGG